jgi:fatty-acyl-CoA synthase
VITQTRPDDPFEKRVTTVGTPLPGVEVRIVDPATLQDVPGGEQGELWSRGYHIMKGYYRDPEATSRAITPEGWLRSGDLAARDSDGYFSITGRLKELIIRGGENIAPKEIEEVLRTHPAVSDAAVFGVPDARFGEEVVAAIRLKPGAIAGQEEIRDFVRARLARFKVPRHVEFVEWFPQTASGKIQRFRLREMWTHSE